MRVFAERLRAREVAPLGGFGVDLERIHAPVEIEMQAQHEAGPGMHAAVRGEVNIAPVQAAAPVQLVDLAVRLDVHVLGQFQAPVHECAVNTPGVGPAPPIYEVEDRIVGIEGLEPCAADTAPDRRLVGDPAEYIHRVAATVVVQAQGGRTPETGARNACTRNIARRPF